MGAMFEVRVGLCVCDEETTSHSDFGFGPMTRLQAKKFSKAALSTGLIHDIRIVPANGAARGAIPANITKYFKKQHQNLVQRHTANYNQLRL